MMRFSAVFVLFLMMFSACKPEPIELSYHLYKLPTELDLQYVHFENADTGYLVAGRQYGAGELYQTVDNGWHWTKILSADYEYSHIVSNGNKLHLVTSSNMLWTSPDKGQSWQPSLLSEWTFWEKGSFDSNGAGLIIGGKNFGAGYIQSLDSNLQMVSYSSNVNQCRDIYRIDDNTLHLVGYGSVKKTTDGGLTWQDSEARGDDYVRVQFVSPTVGYVLGWYGSLLKTTDAGEHWKYIQRGSTLGRRRQNDMFWLDEQTGFLAGKDGLLEKTTDGGKTWHAIPNSHTLDWNSLYYNNNQLFVAGARGWLLVVDM